MYIVQLHALSSGIKAVITWDTARCIDQCRLACGGHGYAHSSGFPELYAQSVAGATYEGENIVMLLQVARFVCCTSFLIQIIVSCGRYVVKRVKANRADVLTEKASPLTQYLTAPKKEGKVKLE